MSTVRDAFATARTLLSDDMGINWPDQLLMPKLIQAHNELVAKLVLNGLKPTRKNSAGITITAGALNMGANQPTDLDVPIKMTESAVGDLASNSFPMTEKDFLPQYDQSELLRYWAYNQGVISFLGATTSRVVYLFYQAILTPPTKVTDTLSVTLSETYLGARVAALCVINSNKSLYELANQIAIDNLSMIVRTNVKSDQIPVRKRPFSYRGRGRLF